MKLITKLWLGIFILILLAPLGLIIPEFFKAGGAWGEWGIEEIKKMFGYLPEGMQKLINLWSAPLPDYAFKGTEDKGLSILSFGYIASGLIGILAVVIAVCLLGKFLVRHEK